MVSLEELSESIEPFAKWVKPKLKRTLLPASIAAISAYFLSGVDLADAVRSVVAPDGVLDALWGGIRAGAEGFIWYTANKFSFDKFREGTHKNQRSLYVSQPLATATLAVSLGLVTLFGTYKTVDSIIDSQPVIETVAQTETQLTPKNLVSSKDSQSGVKDNDIVARKLSGSKKYVNVKDFTVDEDVLEQTQEYFEDLSLLDLMRTTRLNDKFTTYTCFDTATNTINLDAAMEQMWAKKDTLMGLNSDFDNLIKRYGQDFVPGETSTTFEDFKEELGSLLDKYRSGFDMGSFLGKRHQEKQRFIKNLVADIDEDVMMAYAITELFPAINPEVNLIFMDKLLKEGGEDMVTRIPALHDHLLSYGLFQLTSKVIDGRPEMVNRVPYSLNKFLDKSLQLPGSMMDYDELSEHVGGSYINMVYNLQALSNILGNRGLCKKFNDIYEGLPDNEQKLFVAGALSAMHNNPKYTTQGVANFVDQAYRGNVKKEDIAYAVKIPRWTVQRYYDQATETYTLLKNGG